MQKRDRNKTIGGRLSTLSNRDLHAYFTKISWPKKLYEEPIEMSESYTNPHIIPNSTPADTPEIKKMKEQAKQE